DAVEAQGTSSGETKSKSTQQDALDGGHEAANAIVCVRFRCASRSSLREQIIAHTQERFYYMLGGGRSDCCGRDVHRRYVPQGDLPPAIIAIRVGTDIHRVRLRAKWRSIRSM